MNRAMRRMEKKADKIMRRGIPKHGIMTQAQKDRHLATAGAVISGSTTYENDNLDTTLLKIYTAFDALKKGDGTDEHFDYLAAACNSTASQALAGQKCSTWPWQLKRMKKSCGTAHPYKCVRALRKVQDSYRAARANKE